MDYEKTRKDASGRREEVSQRIQAIHKMRSDLQRELEQMERELASLDQILQGLDFYKSDEPAAGEPSGMADCIRHLLQETPVYLLPAQIRDAMNQKGISGTSPKNLLIAVHNVISRLEPFLEKIEINNRPAYRWKQDSAGATKRGRSRSDKSPASRSKQNK
ncbi:MAG: hypothetical protein WBV69_07740 [Candidatus Sulfotelmatobacter sp.]